MSIFVHEGSRVEVPDHIRDLETFRQWAKSDAFPETGRICYLGDIWIDLSMEQAFSHNKLKLAFSKTLDDCAEESAGGIFFTDGMLLTNAEADLCTVADGIYVSNESFENNRVKLVPGKDGGFVELEGSPDMTLEIISTSSVQKDTDLLLDLYSKAGVAEYWLADARGDQLKFEIYNATEKGYRLAKPKGKGWIESAVFGKEFRLTRKENRLGHPIFKLETR